MRRRAAAFVWGGVAEETKQSHCLARVDGAAAEARSQFLIMIAPMSNDVELAWLAWCKPDVFLDSHRRKLLNHCGRVVRSAPGSPAGSLVLGPSGGGKTTFLRTLVHFINAGRQWPARATTPTVFRDLRVEAVFVDCALLPCTASLVDTLRARWNPFGTISPCDPVGDCKQILKHLASERKRLFVVFDNFDVVYTNTCAAAGELFVKTLLALSADEDSSRFRFVVAGSNPCLRGLCFHNLPHPALQAPYPAYHATPSMCQRSTAVLLLWPPLDFSHMREVLGSLSWTGDEAAAREMFALSKGRLCWLLALKEAADAKQRADVSSQLSALPAESLHSSEQETLKSLANSCEWSLRNGVPPDKCSYGVASPPEAYLLRLVSMSKRGLLWFDAAQMSIALACPAEVVLAML